MMEGSSKGQVDWWIYRWTELKEKTRKEKMRDGCVDG